MKDMQAVEKYQQAQDDKWAKKDKDIHLQVCFKKSKPAAYERKVMVSTLKL